MSVVWLVWMACGSAPAPVAETFPLEDAHAALDRLDDRRPLPLEPPMALHQKEQMRGHLEAVQALTAALAVRDWEGVERAGAALGTSPEMSGTCERMGASAPAFTEQALDFHRRADAIGAAARAKDPDAVLRALADTLDACTTCHATWRQQLVDEQ